MATKQITSFPVTTAVDDADIVHINKSNIDNQIAASDLRLYTDQTGAEIKAAYEGEADTNEFDDAEKSKLAGIEDSATADQSDAEIKTAYENNANTNEFDDAEKTKLGTVATNANNYSHPNHTGDVTSSGDGATTIADGVVSYAKMQDAASDNVILGNNNGAGSDFEELTAAQVRTILNIEDGSKDDQDASEVAFTATGDISSTNVQDAIAEVDSEKLGISNNLSDLANAATARSNLSISATNTPSNATGDVVATNVQDAIAELDAEKTKLDSKLTKAVGGSSDVTLTAGEADNRIIELTGVLTGNIDLIVPTTVHRVNYYNNTTGAFSLTVKTAAGTGISVGQGLRQDLSGDGTNVVTLSAGTVVNLNVGNKTATTLDVTNDVGNNATVPSATTSLAGLHSAADKTKLDAITGTNTGDQTKADIDALGINADLLDGLHASSMLRSDADDNLTSAIIVPTANRDEGMFGTYDSAKTQHIWSMGTGYRNSPTGSGYGNLYGLAYKYNASGGSHCTNHIINGVEKASFGTNIWSAGNVTAYSDIRVKTNIEVIPDALAKVGKISGYTFDRTDTDDIARQTGVIAQEILEVLPEAVLNGPTEEDPDGHYSVAYGNMVGLLIEAIKELNNKVDSLQKELENK